mmetsp:Transcript_1873/g.4378  ORF Transcript_1873/g.4378 Transcript_1873/m.4378 type:complete len:506 (+) Transcript_1873:194-1711(+)|eukprot:CAMPEP_0117474102 /NCGR_PEP_ID=MMETSP0784-20121206/9113_1 /TAXON_ID=39447 /ORGANISM="" /LENGTH=505 /DNA_ID=CAMNT_0005268321 /DNA_START=160 /DNA_END=1677 /DNA_ORIENTATION=-
MLFPGATKVAPEIIGLTKCINAGPVTLIGADTSRAAVGNATRQVRVAAALAASLAGSMQRRLRRGRRGPRRETLSATSRSLPARRALPRPDPESLRWSLELAVRTESFEEAARLRDVITQVDSERISVAVSAIARERVRRALDVASAPDALAAQRLEAVDEMRRLATPPGGLAEAEDALHRVLSESAEDEVVELVEAALWSVWLLSGDEAVDAAMRQGLKLMGLGELDKATQAFTEVVDAAPEFAEGWNKRATALFLANRVDESIEDCLRVLALKPRHFGCLSGLGLCFLRKGDEPSAARWFRQALLVNPRGGEDIRRIFADLEARAALSIMRPRIREVLAELRSIPINGGALSSNAGLGAAAMPSSPRVHAEWDVHRVEDFERHTYFFRVRVKCLSGSSVGGMARYYVLKHKDGSVFPLSRITQGRAAFELAFGESYSYSFMFTLRQELLAAKGGLVLRCDGDVFEASLSCLSLQHAPSVREDDLADINNGFDFMGRLEIQVED